MLYFSGLTHVDIYEGGHIRRPHVACMLLIGHRKAKHIFPLSNVLHTISVTKIAPNICTVRRILHISSTKHCTHWHYNETLHTISL